MPYVPPEVVEKAREMDLLTYLKNYEPQELVHFGGNTYCTREHDSLKISNGKWCWFSRGIGGYSALDYLIKVKEMPFTEAVETIMGNVAVSPPAYTKMIVNKGERTYGKKASQDVWLRKLRCVCGSTFRENKWRTNQRGDTVSTTLRANLQTSLVTIKSNFPCFASSIILKKAGRFFACVPVIPSSIYRSQTVQFG